MGYRVTRPRRGRGFTLVELLVAMTIGSLLVVSVVSATRALSTARSSMDRRIERSASARRAMEAIVGALRNVRRDPTRDVPVIVGQRGNPASRGDRLDLQVTSDRRSRPDGPESDQHEVSFYLAKSPEQRLPVLLCRRDHGLDEHPDDGGIATVVAEGIVGLSFEYYADGRWLNEWSSLEPRAPEAVRVIVAAVGRADDESRPRPRPLVLSTVVRIHTNKPIEARPQLQPQSEPRNAGPAAGGPRS